MKIVYILDSLFNAGVQHHVYQLAQGLSDKDQVKIVCLEEKGPLAKDLEAKGIEVVALNTPAVYHPSSIRKIFLLSKLLKNWQANIVQTFLLKANIMGVLAARMAGIKVILSGRTNMGYATKRSHYLVLRLLDYLTTGTVICSKAIMNKTIHTGKIPKGKLFLIYNGIDPDAFSVNAPKRLWERYNIPANKKLIGIVANIRPVKGYEFFVAAAAEIQKQHPETHFLIVGNIHGNESYFDKIKQQIAQHELTSSFTFLHGCTEIPQVLNMMDISVLSSLSEGFSITLLEYMAAGKPIVVTDVGGNSEAVIPNQTGLIVPPANGPKLAEAINHLISKPGLAHRFARNARKRVMDKFDRKVIFNNHRSLYCQLLGFKSDTHQI